MEEDLAGILVVQVGRTLRTEIDGTKEDRMEDRERGRGRVIGVRGM